MEVRDLKPLINVHNYWWWDEKVSKLELKAPVNVLPSTTCIKTLNTMKKMNLNEILIINEDGVLKGTIGIQKLMTQLLAHHVSQDDPVGKIVEEKFGKIKADASLGLLSKILEKEQFAVVIQSK